MLGKAKEVLSVPVNVRELLTVKVLLFAISSVPLEGEMVKPLIDVAVAAPMSGVVSVGEEESTMFPLPVVAVVRSLTARSPVISAVTTERNVGAAALPVVGPAKTVFAL